MNLDIELSFFDTLRLYLVLKNIKDVSTLLGIHSNSVKYRISKCFNSFESDSSNALASLPYLKILLMLEICKVEGPAMLRIYKANEGV
jgi:sugar diacid utilization regulator